MAITDIGTPGGTGPDQPGGTLVCVTTNINTQCCRTSDGGNVGEWHFPDGTIVPRNGNPGDSLITRTGSTQQVRLNRISPTALEPLGEYECRVNDSNGTIKKAVITIRPGKTVVHKFSEQSLIYFSTKDSLQVNIVQQ